MSRHSLANPPNLEPCPFCGSPAKITEDHGEGYSVYGRFWYSVGCGECDVWLHDRKQWNADFRLTLPPMECVGRWNSRAAAEGGNDA